MSAQALQDRYAPGLKCFGCGPANEKGLQIKSYWDGEESVCVYEPRPEQCAGPTHFVYGGTIASLIDCHCVGTAMAHQYDLEQREIGTEPPIWCVTGRLTVNYLAPTPIDKPIELRARIVESAGRKTILKCTLSSEGRATAEGEVIAVRVMNAWREQE